MNKLKEMIKDTVLRFPASILYLIGICVISIIAIHNTSIFMGDLWKKLGTMFVYGSIIAFIVEIILENLGQKKLRFRLMCHGLTYAILQSVCFFKGFRFSGYIFWALLSLAVLVLKSKKRETFELTLANVIVSFGWSCIYSVVLFVGSLIILGSIDSLLISSIPYGFYCDVIILIWCLIFPMIFLSLIPKLGEQLEYPNDLKRFLRFIIVPLELIGMFVLNICSIKFFGDKCIGNAVDLEVSCFLRIAQMFLVDYIFTLILLKPFEEKFYDNIRKWGIFLILPVVSVIFCVVFGRTKIGSNEYLALMTGITSLISLVLIRIKNSKYQYLIFLVLALIILIMGFGPFSMANVTSYMRG